MSQQKQQNEPSKAAARTENGTMAIRKEVYTAVDFEREYQDYKHQGDQHTVAEWILILEAELAEARTALLKKGKPYAIMELVQVAAVAVAALEQHSPIHQPEHATLVHLKRQGAL